MKTAVSIRYLERFVTLGMSPAPNVTVTKGLSEGSKLSGISFEPERGYVLLDWEGPGGTEEEGGQIVQVLMEITSPGPQHKRKSLTWWTGSSLLRFTRLA